MLPLSFLVQITLHLVCLAEAVMLLNRDHPLESILDTADGAVLQCRFPPLPHTISSLILMNLCLKPTMNRKASRSNRIMRKETGMLPVKSHGSITTPTGKCGMIRHSASQILLILHKKQIPELDITTAVPIRL